MNKIIKQYSFEGKDYILVKGLGLEAYEVKSVDMEFFKFIESYVKEEKSKEVLYTLADKLSNLSMDDVVELEYFLSQR